MSDNSDYAPVYRPEENPNTHLNSVIKGAGNFIEKSCVNIIVSGDSNYVGESCLNISILNSSGCIVQHGVIGATIINSSGVIADENNYLCINNTRIRSNGYKVYRANLTQFSTNAPTVVVLENTFGIDFNYSYSGIGTYTVTATGAFPVDSNFSSLMAGVSPGFAPVTTWNDANTFTIVTGANDVLGNTTIEIRQYN